MKGTTIVALRVEYVYPPEMPAEQAEEIAKALVITGAHPFSKVEGVSINEVDFCEYEEKH